MAISLIICKPNWQRRLLVFFGCLFFSPIIFLRLLVNPEFQTNYFIESNSHYGMLELVSIPTRFIIKGIHDFAPGLSKSQVLAILGRPRFTEMKLNFPGCPPEISKADEVWFYEIAPHELVPLCFEGNRCFESRSLQWAEVEGYSMWKTDQIKRVAIGQTPAELEALLGPCFRKYPELVRQVLVLVGNKAAFEGEWAEFPEDIFIGYSSMIRLEMRNGRLAGADRFAVFY